MRALLAGASPAVLAGFVLVPIPEGSLVHPPAQPPATLQPVAVEEYHGSGGTLRWQTQSWAGNGWQWETQSWACDNGGRDGGDSSSSEGAPGWSARSDIVMPVCPFVAPEPQPKQAARPGKPPPPHVSDPPHCPMPDYPPPGAAAAVQQPPPALPVKAVPHQPAQPPAKAPPATAVPDQPAQPQATAPVTKAAPPDRNRLDLPQGPPPPNPPDNGRVPITLACGSQAWLDSSGHCVNRRGDRIDNLNRTTKARGQPGKGYVARREAAYERERRQRGLIELQRQQLERYAAQPQAKATTQPPAYASPASSSHQPPPVAQAKAWVYYDNSVTFPKASIPPANPEHERYLRNLASGRPHGNDGRS